MTKYFEEHWTGSYGFENWDHRPDGWKVDTSNHMISRSADQIIHSLGTAVPEGGYCMLQATIKATNYGIRNIKFTSSNGHWVSVVMNFTNNGLDVHIESDTTVGPSTGFQNIGLNHNTEIIIAKTSNLVSFQVNGESRGIASLGNLYGDISQLTIQSDDSITTWGSIIMDQTPRASIDATINYKTVTFVNYTPTGGLATTYNWDFNDGTHSTETAPVHTYTSLENYTVSLTAQNSDGQMSTSIDIFLVPPPVADIVITPGLEADAPAEFSFTDASTGHIDSWHWTWSNGGYSDVQGPIPSRVYDTVGDYSVTLVVTNTGGSSSKTVHFSVVHRTPVADWYPDQNSGTPPFQVHFNDASLHFPTDWLWDFGDGQTSPEENPTHIYPEIGAYKVTLTVSNDVGSSTSTKLITCIPFLGYISATVSKGEWDVQSDQWDVGDLEVGESATLEVTTTALGMGQTYNLANVSGNEPDPDPLTNYAIVNKVVIINVIRPG